jgi:hypothetical protein
MKILKLSLASLVVVGSLFATVDVDTKVFTFEKQRFLSGQGLKLTNISIAKKVELSLDGWFGYVLNIQANVPNRGLVSGSDMLFSNGEAVATDLISMKDGSSFKDLLTPHVTASYYQKDHLIAGNENAKNKVVVFSDPLCPACISSVPGMIKKSSDKANDIALYYYHFPLLSLHPAAGALSKAMIVAKQKGVENVEMKVLEANFSAYFSSDEKNSQKILDGFNKVFKTDITLTDINEVAIGNEASKDFKMGEDVMVQGTPTLFVNGTNDKTRRLFGALGQ